ncbi:helix-turn-helix domain-containing protein [Amycolatopsis sp. CA-230715]|uniref:helix-turn-helix domain-containing protein n=1 Tax=Amycolatopsis sp. CA-230715 TaxID=2745196 RepID=UPI001C01D008|nr:helix-turn-helix transcriptional regulator [Amycolatopsis sp. CA-230715]QWF82056.1 hypothetical protein HUW46_05493 [Amycolatopsis sp. CA-230715]
MHHHLARVVGDRIRFYRTAAHQTKTVVAGLTGITPDYLYQIERGQKLPTIAVLAQLADVLRVELGDLLSPAPAADDKHTIAKVGATIHRALTGPLPEPTNEPKLAELHHDVLDAWATWQTSPIRYSLLTARLPGLIVETEVALRVAEARDRRAAHRCAADLYGLVRTVTKRIGRRDVSLLVADRAIRAAEVADDPVRLAAANWNLAQVLLADNEPEMAGATAIQARESLQSRVCESTDARAVSGSLLLISAIAAVRRGNPWTARDRLREAVTLAAQVGERNTCWTAFGPTNVAMYAVSVEIESGEAVEGLRLAKKIDQGRSPSIERRVAFLLDQAKGHGQRRDYAAALQLLNTAENEAPEDIRHRPSAHAVLHTVMERGRRSTAAEAARLAGEIGLPQ